MKTKRKGPRWSWVFDDEHREAEFRDALYPHMRIKPSTVVARLNAGERAKAEVKRLKEELSNVRWALNSVENELSRERQALRAARGWSTQICSTCHNSSCTGKCDDL